MSTNDDYTIVNSPLSVDKNEGEQPSQDEDVEQESRDAKVKKRLIVFCDGTNNGAAHATVKPPSNVTRFARSLVATHRVPASDSGQEEEVQQIVLYQTGVGKDAGLSAIGSVAAAAFGFGLEQHVLEAYHFFSTNYERGDELFLFGFSRGAFTARAIASFMCHVGLLKREHLQLLTAIHTKYKKLYREADDGAKWNAWCKEVDLERLLWTEGRVHHRVDIAILGVWDTVGSLGLPETWMSKYLKWIGIRDRINDQYSFHDMKIGPRSDDDSASPKPSVEKILHALSLDDHRISFTPTLFFAQAEGEFDGGSLVMDESKSYHMLQQCWFPGGHTDVGGGFARDPLDISDIALAWMVDRCNTGLGRDFGLSFSKDFLQSLQQPTTEINNDTLRPHDAEKAKGGRWGLSAWHDSIYELAFRFAGSRTRTPGEYFLGKRGKNKLPVYTNEMIHPSVRVRLLENLKPTLNDPKAANWQKYLPKSLAGFQLQPCTVEMGKTWEWVKAVKGKDGKSYEVRIREHKIFGPKDNEPETSADPDSEPVAEEPSEEVAEPIQESIEETYGIERALLHQDPISEAIVDDYDHSADLLNPLLIKLGKRTWWQYFFG